MAPLALAVRVAAAPPGGLLPGSPADAAPAAVPSLPSLPPFPLPVASAALRGLGGDGLLPFRLSSSTPLPDLRNGLECAIVASPLAKPLASGSSSSRFLRSAFSSRCSSSCCLQRGIGTGTRTRVGADQGVVAVAAAVPRALPAPSHTHTHTSREPCACGCGSTGSSPAP